MSADDDEGIGATLRGKIGENKTRVKKFGKSLQISNFNIKNENIKVKSKYEKISRVAFFCLDFCLSL